MEKRKEKLLLTPPLWLVRDQGCWHWAPKIIGLTSVRLVMLCRSIVVMMLIRFPISHFRSYARLANRLLATTNGTKVSHFLLYRTLSVNSMRVVSRQCLVPGMRTMLNSMSVRVAPFSSGYPYLTEEAEDLIARSYARHKRLSETGNHTCPPALAVKDLEQLETPIAFPISGVKDRIAKTLVDVLEKVMHLFFRDRYINHAVTLETVAAVPGIVASMHRHLRSLRTMKRDYNWIGPLQEE